jgi:DNA-binding IclR family transcriptional regulator
MLSVNSLVFPVKAVGTTAARSTAGTVSPMAEAKVGVAPKAAPGSQTLARGLSALELIAATPGGVTVQEIADRVGVHRTVAYRLLSTLVQFRLVARHDDGRYRSAAGLAVLGSSFDRSLRETSVPILRALADELRTTVALLVAEGEEQVSVAVIVPADVSYQLSFREGSRYPLDRGAAGIALLACRPPRPGERALVGETRERGWVITHGEIEPGTYGLAVPVARPDSAPATCINLISHRRDVVERSRDAVIAAAARLSAVLS